MRQYAEPMQCCLCGRRGTRGFVAPNGGSHASPGNAMCAARKACQTRRARLYPHIAKALR